MEADYKRSSEQVIIKSPLGSFNDVRKMMTNLPKRPPVDMYYKNLEYSVLDSQGYEGLIQYFKHREARYKRILKGVSGRFKSGELTAIMGPSGAGKSTLLNIMTGYKTSNVSGKIYINGKIRNLRLFRKMSCYIMQDDSLCPHLSVEEAMNSATNLKLGEKTPKDEKALVIKEIIDNLGLSECFKTRTSDLSGGQRKRLAVALELVNNPPVMFFDEPTSGLDSSSCSQCIALLKQLAREGRTIICTIHQPSSRIFERFDNLVVIAEGRNVYQGSVKGLVSYLNSFGLNCPSYHNPADFIMEIASGEYGREHLEELFNAVSNDDSLSSSIERLSDEESSYYSLSEADKELDFPTSFSTQFSVLFIRNFKSIIRDTQLSKIRLISIVAIGFILGSLYWNVGNEASKVYNNSAMIFFCMLYNMFASMMPTVMTFPSEIDTFKREHLNYWYSMKSYYLAKGLADLPFQVIFPTLFVLIVYFMTSQPLEATRFFMFLLMTILVSLVAQSFGLLVGIGFSAESAVFLGPVSTVPLLLFSGFFVTLKNIPGTLHWLTYVMYVRYGFEGSMLAIYGNDRGKLECSKAYCHFKYPQKLLEEFSIEQGIFWVDVVALLGIFFVLRISGYIVLKCKIRLSK